MSVQFIEVETENMIFRLININQIRQVINSGGKTILVMDEKLEVLTSYSKIKEQLTNFDSKEVKL